MRLTREVHEGFFSDHHVSEGKHRREGGHVPQVVLDDPSVLVLQPQGQFALRAKHGDLGGDVAGKRGTQVRKRVPGKSKQAAGFEHEVEFVEHDSGAVDPSPHR